MPPTIASGAATLADTDVLVHHRIAMFTDMGVAARRDRRSTARSAPGCADDDAGRHLSRLAGRDARTAAIVAGGGITILPWPPGPRYAGDRLAFVYNVYTEPAHRAPRPRAPDHGRHPRLVPRARASRSWRSTPAGTASRSTSRWAIA